MAPSKNKVVVYYDGACPKCIRDRRRFERLAGANAQDVCWFDITDQDDELNRLGIDPRKALKELHLKDERGQILSELDAYILLMQKTIWLKPLAWLLGLPMLRPRFARAYHRMVERRLKREGRWYS